MLDYIRANSFIRRYPVIKEFIKFCIVGFSNLVIDMAVYFILTRYVSMYYMIASVFSFWAAVTWSFYINRRWTFKIQGVISFTQYGKFVAANVLGMSLSLLLLFLLVDVFSFHDMAAKFIAAVMVAIVNFALNKYWTFHRGTKSETLVI